MVFITEDIHSATITDGSKAFLANLVEISTKTSIWRYELIYNFCDTFIGLSLNFALMQHPYFVEALGIFLVLRSR